MDPRPPAVKHVSSVVQSVQRGQAGAIQARLAGWLAVRPFHAPPLESDELEKASMIQDRYPAQ
jgi:hypothetical protein